MKNRSWIALLAVVALVGGSVPAVRAIDAATQEHIRQLQAQIDALQAQATQYRQNIAGEQAKASSLKGEISILQNQINAIQSDITATDRKIDKTQLEIEAVQGQIGQTRADIDQRREAIGRMVFFLDQKDHENLLASLFKYPNLSAFLQQFHDLAAVQGTVMSTITDLKYAKASLEGQQMELQEKQDELQNLKNQAAQRKTALGDVKYQKDRLLRDTKGQEALYQKQLVDNQKKVNAFFAELQKLESQVIAGGLYIVHVTAGKLPPRGTKLFGLPEAHPRLTQGYGMTTYARRGAYGGAAHNGVDFASGYGTPILAIGDGTLVARGNNEGWGNWVAIQHPNNLVSLYGHMSAFDVSISVGSTVRRGQQLGYEGNTGNATGSHVHLSLYKDFFTYVNEKNGQLYFNYFEGSINPLDYM